MSKIVSCATHLQLPRVVAVVLERDAAMLCLFMRVNGIGVQPHVCWEAIAIALRKRGAGAIITGSSRKASGDDSRILVNQTCLRHLTCVTTWSALSNIPVIAVWGSRNGQVSSFSSQVKPKDESKYGRQTGSGANCNASHSSRI
jgi:hypothetical protein